MFARCINCIHKHDSSKGSAELLNVIRTLEWNTADLTKNALMHLRFHTGSLKLGHASFMQYTVCWSFTSSCNSSAQTLPKTRRSCSTRPPKHSEESLSMFELRSQPLQDMWPTVGASWNLKSQKSFSTLRRTISTFQAHCWNGPLFFLKSKRTKTRKPKNKLLNLLYKLLRHLRSSWSLRAMVCFLILVRNSPGHRWTQQDSTGLNRTRHSSNIPHPKLRPLVSSWAQPSRTRLKLCPGHMLCWRSTPLLRLLGKKLRTYIGFAFSHLCSLNLLTSFCNISTTTFLTHMDAHDSNLTVTDSWSFLFKSLLEMNPIYEDVASGGSSQSPTDFWQLLRTVQNSSIFL